MSIRDEIVKIASEQVGYKEYSNNMTKYGEWYGLQGEWCDIFISWLASQVGILYTLIPKEAYVPNTASWYKEKGLLKDRNYTPQKGDLILFDYNKNRVPDHIGIVEKVEGNVIHAIEGNKSKMVKRQAYAIGNSQIYGIAVVEYKDDNRKTIDELAREVIDNKWGTGEDRKRRLTDAGYDYYAVQKKVNEILRTPKVEPQKYVKGKYVVNTPKGLNVRKGPGTNYGIKKTYKNGTRFDTLEIKGDWGRSPSRMGESKLLQACQKILNMLFYIKWNNIVISILKQEKSSALLMHCSFFVNTYEI